MNNVVSLENKKIPLQFVINLNGSDITDSGNIYNNNVNAVYFCGLMGYHKVKIVRFQVIRDIGKVDYNPLALALVSPVFQQKGNFQYPVMITNPKTLLDGGGVPIPPPEAGYVSPVYQMTSVSDDCEYIYNFSNNFPLYIGDIFTGYQTDKTFFNFKDPKYSLIAVLNLSVEKM